MSEQPATIKGHVLTPRGFVRGELAHRDGRIHSISGPSVTLDEVLASDQPIVLPGFVDLHVHGGGGHDVMQGGNAVQAIARQHAQHGTTSWLATTMTAPLGEIAQALDAALPTFQARPAQSARLLGIHLEGPYINAERLGAQPDFVRPISVDEILALHARAPIRLITLAPEVPGAMPMIGALRQAGFVLAIGHSQASYDEAVAALDQGATGFTHLFNAMSPLQHRAPGAVGAALAHAQFAELIPDLLHVHPGAIRAALRAIPCLFCVTDATSAAGMPDGDYRLGRHRVTKCQGGVRLADGTLAGSTLTMDQALRNLVNLGVPLDDAARRVSTFAADFLGEAQRGRLQAGAWADIVVLDTKLQLTQVWVEGEPVALKAVG